MFCKSDFNRLTILATAAGGLIAPLLLLSTVITQGVHVDVTYRDWFVILTAATTAGTLSGFSLYIGAYLPLKRVINTLTKPRLPASD